MTQVVLASHNAHKLEELRGILEPIVPGIELIAYDGPEPVEDGLSFEENALLKAREAVRHTGLPAVADDSGLTVAALNGMPGVLSARWAGGHRASQRESDDLANLRLVLDQVRDVPDERRDAAFVCAAALVTPDGIERVVHGQVDGVLLREPRGISTTTSNGSVMGRTLRGGRPRVHPADAQRPASSPRRRCRSDELAGRQGETLDGTPP